MSDFYSEYVEARATITTLTAEIKLLRAEIECEERRFNDLLDQLFDVGEARYKDAAERAAIKGALINLLAWANSVKKRVGLQMGDAATGAITQAEQIIKEAKP